jgi:hypothetical protein
MTGWACRDPGVSHARLDMQGSRPTGIRYIHQAEQAGALTIYQGKEPATVDTFKVSYSNLVVQQSSPL